MDAYLSSKTRDSCYQPGMPLQNNGRYEERRCGIVAPQGIDNSLQSSPGLRFGKTKARKNSSQATSKVMHALGLDRESYKVHSVTIHSRLHCEKQVFYNLSFFSRGISF